MLVSTFFWSLIFLIFFFPYSFCSSYPDFFFLFSLFLQKTQVIYFPFPFLFFDFYFLRNFTTSYIRDTTTKIIAPSEKIFSVDRRYYHIFFVSFSFFSFYSCSFTFSYSFSLFCSPFFVIFPLSCCFSFFV